MNKQIKYEAVFGDQDLFIPAPSDAIVVRYVVKDFYNYESEVTSTTGKLRDYPIVAMRRIIKAPVWTVADQKAGRLPDVGCLVKEKTTSDYCGYECIVRCIFESEVCVQFDDGSFRIDTIDNIEPIETPAEKAQRLRMEWCNEAGLVCSLGMTTLTRIYDAMLSGELKMPEVQK